MLQIIPSGEASALAGLLGIPVARPAEFAVSHFILSDGRQIIVVTEIADNPGPSVTSAWPQLAGELFESLSVPSRERVQFVEHYFSGSYNPPVDDPHYPSFAWVDIVWREGRAQGHSWRPVPR